MAAPDAWTPDDAKDVLWALVRLLDAPAVYRVSLIEVEAAKFWRIEVQAPSGVAMTPALRLSSTAYVWLSEAAFEVPGIRGAH